MRPLLATSLLASFLLLTTGTAQESTDHLNPVIAKLAAGKTVYGLINTGDLSLANARSGFRNDGQFVAALHASRNLNIPFVTLKDAMTGSNPVSLGQAIHVLRPSVDATAEANRAEMQATSDLRR